MDNKTNSIINDKVNRFRQKIESDVTQKVNMALDEKEDKLLKEASMNMERLPTRNLRSRTRKKEAILQDMDDIQDKFNLKRISSVEFALENKIAPERERIISQVHEEKAENHDNLYQKYKKKYETDESLML
jgi:folate-binding Fe-S cluster repair protein YgfZ